MNILKNRISKYNIITIIFKILNKIQLFSQIKKILEDLKLQ